MAGWWRSIKQSMYWALLRASSSECSQQRMMLFFSTGIFYCHHTARLVRWPGHCLSRSFIRQCFPWAFASWFEGVKCTVSLSVNSKSVQGAQEQRDNKGYVLLFFLARNRNEKEEKRHQGSLLAMCPVNDLPCFSKYDIWLILTF